MTRALRAFTVSCLLFFGASISAHAQDTDGVYMADDSGLMPAVSYMTETTGYEGDLSDPTHPPVRLTPDKSELVRLKREAGSVVVGNPAHVSVLMDTPQLAVLVPKSPGATYITFLDDDGGVIMSRHIIVAAPSEKYIRVRRACINSSDENCASTSVFYCPDMCHEIRISGESSEDGQGDMGSGAGGPDDMAEGMENMSGAAGSAAESVAP